MNPSPVPPAVAMIKPVNVWAIVAFVCGLCGFAIITIPVAIVLGIVGFVLAKPPRGGKILSILAIVFALLWTGGAGVGGVVMYRYFAAVSAEAKAPAVTFLNAIADSDTQTLTQVSTFSPQQLPQLQALLPGLGRVKTFDTTGVFTRKNVGKPTRFQLKGTARFDNGQR